MKNTDVETKIDEIYHRLKSEIQPYKPSAYHKEYHLKLTKILMKQGQDPTFSLKEMV